MQDDPVKHHLLGYPDVMQGEMEPQCEQIRAQLNIGREPAQAVPVYAGATWRVLAQIDSDWDARMQWGDAGRLYFWIHLEDLKRADFSHVWLMLQCG